MSESLESLTEHLHDALQLCVDNGMESCLSSWP